MNINFWHTFFLNLEKKIMCNTAINNVGNLNVIFGNLLKEIDAKKQYEKHSAGIIVGGTGIVLVSFIFYQITGKNKYWDETKNRIIEIIDNIKDNYSFGYGLCGISWIIRIILQSRQDDELLRWLKDADKILFRELKLQLGKKNLDFFDGALGLLFYFVQTDPMNAELKKLVCTFVEILERRCMSGNWYQKCQNEKNEYQRINLGVPHGITGLLLFSLIIKEKDIINDNMSPVIKKIIDLLFSFTEHDSVYTFPSYVDINNINKMQRKKESSIAWCYGDLSVAYAILKAGILLKNNDYIQIALPILQKTIQRSGPLNGELTLCHGHISRSIIYAQIYSLTADSRFKDASEFWSDVAENVFFERYSLYFQKKLYTPFFHDPSLFLGFSGFLIHKLTKGESKRGWASCLLL